MKKIINQPGDIVSQMIKGLASAHADILAQVPDTQVLYRTAETPNIVGIVSGGGSGTNQVMQDLSVKGCCQQLFLGKSLLLQRQTKF